MTKPTIQERRKFKRRNLSYYLPILDNDTQQVLGHLVDVSLVGIMIDCKKNIPSGQKYNLRLDLMEKVGEKSSIELTAFSANGAVSTKSSHICITPALKSPRSQKKISGSSRLFPKNTGRAISNR